MQLLSTIALLAIAIQCVLASPERKLLRSGYDSPIDFSNLTGGGTTGSTTQKQSQHDTDAVVTGLSGVDSLTKSLSGVTGVTSGEGGLSKLLPSGLPSTETLSSLTKNGGSENKLLPMDLSALSTGGALSSLTGGSGLNSITSGLTKGADLESITSGITKGGKLPSLPGLPIGGGNSNGVDATKDLSSVPDSLSGLTDGVGLPSTVSGTNGKQAYSTAEAAGDK